MEDGDLGEPRARATIQSTHQQCRLESRRNAGIGKRGLAGQKLCLTCKLLEGSRQQRLDLWKVRRAVRVPDSHPDIPQLATILDKPQKQVVEHRCADDIARK